MFANRKIQKKNRVLVLINSRIADYYQGYSRIVLDGYGQKDR